MKLFNKIAIAVLTVCSMSACTEYAEPGYYESADVDFTYNVEGDEYLLDFYVVSTIQFNNTSAKDGNFTWDFGDDTPKSTEKNPTHKYETAGNYEVTLTLEGVGTRTYPIMIYDIAPVLSVATQSTEFVEYGTTEITFNIELPNPENLPVRYEWTFPDGTLRASDGTEMPTHFIGEAKMDENGEYKIEYPEPVKFQNIGSQRVDIQTYFNTAEGGEPRRLADAYLNVQVCVAEPAPTIYYAQRGGNIKALKLLDEVPEGVKVKPYDLGVPTGATVLTLLCNTVTSKPDEDGNVTSQDWVYILDAGKQFTYVNDEGGVLGDGQMTAMKADGTGVNVVVTNVGQPAFNDPYRGFILNDVIYYSDRNTGYTKIDCTTRGAVEGIGDSNRRASYVSINESTPFYGRGITWGAVTYGIYKDKKGYWWEGKSGNGKGIFRYKDSDIYATQAEAAAHEVPSTVLCSNLSAPTCFAVDEERSVYYVYDAILSKFMQMPFEEYKIPDGQKLQGELFSKVISASQDNTVSNLNEGIFISQMAVDSETGKVFFCFRPSASDASGLKAGIVMFDPATKTLSNYGDTSDLGTGIVINPTKTKLF